MANPLILAFDIKDDGTVAVKKFEKGLDKLDDRIKGADQRTKKFDRTMNRLRGTTSNVTRRLRQLTAGLASVGIGIGVGLAIGKITTFERSMAQVGAVTQATEADLQSLQDTARTLGATTQFSAAQAASGMEFLGRAGFETTKIIEAMPAVLNLSTAAQLEMGRAADITSNIMSAFGLAASEASNVTDILAKAAASANTDVEQLGQGMKFVGPIAKAMGISLSDTAAAVAVLSDAGIQGAQAGTNLRQILLTLIKPTKDARAVFADLNIGLDEINPTMNSLTSIFVRLKEAGLDAEDAVRIFSSRTAGAATILTDTNEKLNKFTELFADAKNFAADMAETIGSDLLGAFRGLLSIVDEVILLMGESGLRDEIFRLTKTMTEQIRALAKNERAMRAFKVAVGFAGGAVVFLIENIRSLITALLALVAIEVAANIGTITVAIKSLTAAMVALKFASLPFLGKAGILFALAFGFAELQRRTQFITVMANTMAESVALMANSLQTLAEVTKLTVKGIFTLDLDQGIGEALERGRQNADFIKESFDQINAEALEITLGDPVEVMRTVEQALADQAKALAVGSKEVKVFSTAYAGLIESLVSLKDKLSTDAIAGFDALGDSIRSTEGDIALLEGNLQVFERIQALRRARGEDSGALSGTEFAVERGARLQEILALQQESLRIQLEQVSAEVKIANLTLKDAELTEILLDLDSRRKDLLIEEILLTSQVEGLRRVIVEELLTAESQALNLVNDKIKRNADDLAKANKDRRDATVGLVTDSLSLLGQFDSELERTTDKIVRIIQLTVSAIENINKLLLAQSNAAGGGGGGGILGIIGGVLKVLGLFTGGGTGIPPVDPNIIPPPSSGGNVGAGAFAPQQSRQASGVATSQAAPQYIINLNVIDSGDIVEEGMETRVGSNAVIKVTRGAGDKK